MKKLWKRQSCPLRRECKESPRLECRGLLALHAESVSQAGPSEGLWALIKGLIPLQKEEKVGKNNAGICPSTWSSSLRLFESFLSIEIQNPTA